MDVGVRLSRRQFIRTAVAGAGAAAGARLFGVPSLLGDSSPNSTLGTVLIGCGGQGRGSHIPAAVRERLVALVDADETNLAKALARAKQIEPGVNISAIRTFTDYRKMFEVMGKEIDAVFIATPNHHHALPALMAMQMGKGVYVEKPMAYDIQEARTMAAWARRCKVATQMGNQGHSGEGWRRLCEYIWAGAIGNVTEVHAWSNRANGGSGGRPLTLAVPKGLHWDEWIGPAPFRNYHKELHPHEWHGWHDFGNGSLGNMGCHVLDGAVWALKLEHPTSIEVEDMGGGSAERYPTRTRIRWDFPARGDMPAVKVYWYDGKKMGKGDAGAMVNGVSKGASNRPPVVVELEKKYKRDFGDNGAIYVGEKGIMCSGTYGEGVRIVPEEKHREYTAPAKSLPRIKGSHMGDFLRACRGGGQPASHFEVAAGLTEIVLLGCLAIKAGAHQKLVWDGPAMKCANLPAINEFLQRENRAGWRI